MNEYLASHLDGRSQSHNDDEYGYGSEHSGDARRLKAKEDTSKTPLQALLGSVVWTLIPLCVVSLVHYHLIKWVKRKYGPPDELEKGGSYSDAVMDMFRVLRGYVRGEGVLAKA